MMKPVVANALRAAFPIPEAADYLGISRSTLWRLTKDGKLPVIKLRGRTVISRAACDALLAQSV